MADHEPAEPAELARRARAGEWLTVTETQVLFSVKSRSTVHRWLEAGRVRWKLRSGKMKELHPEDLVAMLDERQQVRRGPARAGDPEQQ